MIDVSLTFHFIINYLPFNFKRRNGANNGSKGISNMLSRYRYPSPSYIIQPIMVLYLPFRNCSIRQPFSGLPGFDRDGGAKKTDNVPNPVVPASASLQPNARAPQYKYQATAEGLKSGVAELTSATAAAASYRPVQQH
jgi:hypothetical protein